VCGATFLSLLKEDLPSYLEIRIHSWNFQAGIMIDLLSNVCADMLYLSEVLLISSLPFDKRNE
jgi:hypothetical protein